MRLNSRQQFILRALETSSYAEVKQLAKQLGVDVSTVRRDLQGLVSAGYVERSHGGVRPPGGKPLGPGNPPQMVADAIAIARFAATLVVPGSRVALSGGSIGSHLATQLLEVADITVVTNSLDVCTVLSTHDSVRLIFASGELRPHGTDHVAAGENAIHVIESTSTDFAFVDADSVHAKHGACIHTPWLAEALKTMLYTAKRRCILCLGEGMGEIGASRLCAPGDIDLVFTSDSFPDSQLPPYGGRLVRCQPGKINQLSPLGVPL